jgi:hypothetical protein
MISSDTILNGLSVGSLYHLNFGSIIGELCEIEDVISTTPPAIGHEGSAATVHVNVPGVNPILESVIVIIGVEPFRLVIPLKIMVDTLPSNAFGLIQIRVIC